MPASIDALNTIIQFTSVNTALVPMVATAVCAIVLTARMPAAFDQFFPILHACAPFRVSTLSHFMRPLQIRNTVIGYLDLLIQH